MKLTRFCQIHPRNKAMINLALRVLIQTKLAVLAPVLQEVALVISVISSDLSLTAVLVQVLQGQADKVIDP